MKIVDSPVNSFESNRRLLVVAVAVLVVDPAHTIPCEDYGREKKVRRLIPQGAVEFIIKRFHRRLWSDAPAHSPGYRCGWLHEMFMFSRLFGRERAFVIL